MNPTDCHRPTTATRVLTALRPTLGRVGLALALVQGAPMQAWALGEKAFIEETGTKGAAALVYGGSAAAIVVDSNDHAGVWRAARDLQEDVLRVSGSRPELGPTAPRLARTLVVVGTLGRSPLIDQLVRSGKLSVGEIEGRWEASVIQTVERPFAGVERALVLAGSDKRGTIYAIYDLSEQMGVSPWYWWADVPVRQKPVLFARAGRYVRPSPAVKYRGIFINDEAPALAGWVTEKFGGFGKEFYSRVFELILRLRGNFLWPAMWGRAFADDDKENPRLADEFGVVIGTSHHEPMMRAHDEWRRYGKGRWDYGKNADVLKAFWTEGIERTAKYESVVTLAMRGDGDEPMSDESNVALLERIVGDQREILAQKLGPDLSAVPQVWALYKEVQDYYERGMRVPDDVTLLWCDDNWGNIRRLPTTEERKRSGGAGVYYHFDYVGGPRSYKWLNVTPIAKVWEQMHLAYRYGADRLWIVNVGDIKPMEYPTQFFLDYAWDPSRWGAERLPEYARSWARREFGEKHADEIASIITTHTRYTSRRRPEMLEPSTYSLVDYREAETVVSDYRALEERAEAVARDLPPQARDAYFQLVLHPVKACALLSDLYVTVGRNRLYAVQGRTSTNDLAERARALFREDAALTRRYNEELGGGKWSHMMDQTHIGYTFWNHPVRNAMPGVQEIQPSQAPALGVALEGSPGSWPVDNAPQATLPALSVFDPSRSRFIDVFNRGLGMLDFSIETGAPWVVVDKVAGQVERDQRLFVSVDWSAVPPGAESAQLTVHGPGGASVRIKLPLFNPASPRPSEVRGFVETSGYLSVEAEHFERSVAPTGREWKVIPGHGRTLSGVTALPVGTAGSPGSTDAMRLEYAMHLFSTGTVRVDLHLAPTANFQPGPGLRYAVSFDDEAPQMVNIHSDSSLALWERRVGEGVAVVSSTHSLARPGAHVLKLWAVDGGLVFQKIVVDTGGLRPSYLGPPESPRMVAPAAAPLSRRSSGAGGQR